MKALGDQNAATINLNRDDRNPSRVDNRILGITSGTDINEDSAVQAGKKLELRSAIRGKIVGIYRKCLFALKDKNLSVLGTEGGEDRDGEVKNRGRKSREMVYEMKEEKDDLKWKWRREFTDNGDNNDANNDDDGDGDDELYSNPSHTSPFDQDKESGYRSFSTSEFTSSQTDRRTFLEVTGRFNRRIDGGGGEEENRGGERIGGEEEKQGLGQEEEVKDKDGMDKGEGRRDSIREGKKDQEEEGPGGDRVTRDGVIFPGPKACSWLDRELGLLRGLYECEIRMLEDVIRNLRTSLQDSSPKRKNKNRLSSANQKTNLDRKLKQSNDFVVRHVSEKEQPLPSQRMFFNSTL